MSEHIIHLYGVFNNTINEIPTGGDNAGCSCNIILKTSIILGVNKFLICIIYKSISTEEAVMVMIVRQLDLQLPMQLVPITTKVVSSHPVIAELYSIQQLSHPGPRPGSNKYFSFR
jgi:hypothetical protein